MDLTIAIIRLAVALALGATIGFERQWHQKMAGLRTNALVSIGSCGFVVFSAMVGGGDPTRVAAQVVSGIGFLGAGVILREGINVHGLNTAATLWCSAMVGTFAGAGFLAPSLVAAAFVVATNLLVRRMVERLNRRILAAGNVETHYTVAVTCRGAEVANIRAELMAALTKAGLGLQRIDSEGIPATTRVAVKAQAIAASRQDAALEQLVGRLSLEPHVSAAAWQIDRSVPEA